jgi:hypothetical protein
MFDNTPRGRVERAWSDLQSRVTTILTERRGVRKVAHRGADLALEVESIADGAVVRRPLQFDEPTTVMLERGARPAQPVFELRASVVTTGESPPLLRSAARLAELFSRVEDHQLLYATPDVLEFDEEVTTRVDGTVLDRIVARIRPSSPGILQVAQRKSPPSPGIDEATISWLIRESGESARYEGFSLLVPRDHLPSKPDLATLEQCIGGKIEGSDALERDALFVRSSPPSIELRLALDTRLELAKADDESATLALTERIAWTQSADPVIFTFVLA